MAPLVEPAGQLPHSAARVRATILTIIGVAGIFGAVEAFWGLEQQSTGLVTLGVGTAAFATTLAWPLGLNARGQSARAALVTCIAILCIQAVYMVGYPAAYPAIVIASIVIVALALSFVQGPALLRVTIAAWATAVAAVLAGNMAPGRLELPPQGRLIVLVGSGVAAVTVVMVLLWNFASDFTQALAAARAGNDELIRANEKLQDLERMKSEFINAAAHELNTPLTPVMIQLNLLRSAARDQRIEDGEKSIQVLERNLNRINGLVQEMLQIARLQSGRLAPRRIVFDAVGPLRDAIADFSGPATQRDLRLTLDAPGAMPVRGDPRHLAQVASNLLSNAVRLTPRGGAIQIEFERGADAVLVRVRDSGIGLTAAQLAALFQPFARVHEEEISEKGTGLGLYISRGLIQEMGGQLWAESAGPGKGATFTVSLPGAPPIEPPSTQPTA